jgi:glutaredoxin 3
MKYFKIICWSECPFCLKAKTLLIEEGIPFEYCSVDHSQKLLDYYKKVYKHDTVPMVIELNTGAENERFIGGYTELKKLLEKT